jgi:hypothetical protein
MMSAPSRRLCVMALLLTFRLVMGQTPVGLLEQQFKRADSALSNLLERPETRMKEIAPVEDLFGEALSDWAEFTTVLRTNSKGQIVNIATRDDSAFVKNADVSNKDWYSEPQESKRPYYGPIVYENQRSYLFWSKPILVRNSLGLPRFGGVIAAKISLPVCFKLFAARFQGPFQIVLKGKEFYYLSWDERAPYEEKTVHVPGVSGLTCRFVSKKQSPDSMSASSASAAAPKVIAAKGTEIHDMAITAKNRMVNAPVVDNRNNITAAPLKKTPAQAGMNKITVPGLVGTIAILALFITGLFVSRARKNRVGKTPPAIESPKELDDAIRQSLDNELQQNIPMPEMEEKARADLTQELKKEVFEKEADIIKNNVRAEIRENIRSEIRTNEALAMRAVVEQELTDSWREEIKTQQYEVVRERELENIKKIVQEKLLEKEMPLLVETYRKELSKEIRQKIVGAFSGQIEESARQALREEITQKLRESEYERLVLEEKEKLRGSIAEKEMEPIRERLHEELTEQIKAEVREETEGVRGRLREEMAIKIRRELQEREYEALVNNHRDELKKRIHDEIAEKDLPAIRDEMRSRIVEEERTRINDRERPEIVEAERNRLREQEGPGLRQEIRVALHEEEVEAMHARVKTEIYTETVQSLKAGLEEKYRGAVEKELEKYKDEFEKRVRGEIKGRIKSEYHGLIEHIEGLSRSMDNVEALDSLTQTIALLHEEKKKYKYFNLNTAQTESLLEYLKRVQNRFGIFLDKLDEAVREMVLKVNSVMNTLDNSDSD